MAAPCCTAVQLELALLKLKHLRFPCRKANRELLRSSPNITEQARELQAELREMQQRVHALHVVAWQRMLPAPAMEL